MNYSWIGKKLLRFRSNYIQLLLKQIMEVGISQFKKSDIIIKSNVTQK